MKKILSILICIQMLYLPVFAQYDFSDEAQAEFDRNKQILLNQQDFTKKKTRKNTQNAELEDRSNYLPDENLLQNIQPQLYGSVVEIPSGTSFSVTFDSGISSGSLDKNDRLAVKLTNDLIYNGQLIAPAGSLVYGSATDAKNAGYAYGNAQIELNFNQIIQPNGNALQISTENIYMESKSERAKNMTRDVVVGALGSLLVGLAFTALGGGDSCDYKRNMIIYGGLGAVGGGLRGAMQRGKEVDIPDGTTVRIKLLKPLITSPYLAL